MANYFTVSTRKDFNTRLWARAAVDRQYNYKQPEPGKKVKRAVAAEEGEPPGLNDGKKNYHLNFVQFWWALEEYQAGIECRPVNYTLVHEPPAPGSDQTVQANGAKLLAFYRNILELFDADDQQIQGINTQTEKTMLGFFEDLLAAQFADCPKDLQEYAILSAADKTDIKAVAKRIDTKVRERVQRKDAYSETMGAALTEEDMLKYYHITVNQAKYYNWDDILSLKAVFVHMYLNANRAVREISFVLKNVVDEELDRSAKSTLSGVSTDRLLVHGFTLQTGGPESQDKNGGKTARYELDGFMRHAILDLCAASKIADYMLARFRDLPLQPALASAEALLAFLDQKFFMRHKKKGPPEKYGEHTIRNVMKGAPERNCPGLESKVGVEHVEGKLIHRIKHGAVRSHLDSLGSGEEARRYAKHGGKVHEASYSNRTWGAKLAMAKVAGHRDGFVRLYRAGIWCSLERDAAFKGLFDCITPVTDAQLAAAEALMEGRKEWAGVRATLAALRNYADVILQDLVELCVHPIMGPDYLAAADRFPFLATRHAQHADWLRFCTASRAKAAAMRAADGEVALQEPQTPPGLPPVQQLPPVLQLPPVQQRSRAATIDFLTVVPGALTGPKGGSWTPAALYARYSESLMPGVPPLREIMVEQGHLDWARTQAHKKKVHWMNKFWCRIRCEVNSGKTLQQALEDAEKEFNIWSSPEQKLKRKRDSNKDSRGFKSWVEEEVPSQINGWHLL